MRRLAQGVEDLPRQGFGAGLAQDDPQARQRMGEDKLVGLIQESLAVATRMGAAKPADFRQVVIDTTVQEKAIAFPTDAKLMHRARERLARLAQASGVALRQSYVRVGKIALDQAPALCPRQAVQ